MTDRLPREDWAHLVPQVRLGERRRFQHLCGGGTSLLVSRDLAGARAYCFRCDAADRMPPPHLTLSQMLEAKREAARADEEVQRRGDELPAPLLLADSLPDWAPEARLWLARAGLGAFEIARLGAGYHPPSKRVVLPVLEAGKLVYWQARSVDGRMPKYLGAESGKDAAVPRWGDHELVAVTEDILSAYKIGLSGGEAWCALGVKPHARFVALLMASGKRPVVWLDPDPAGQAGATKLLRQLRAYGLAPMNIMSREDPKLLQRKEIHDILEHHLAGG